MSEMMIAKLAETARRMKADGHAKTTTVAIRVHVNEEDQTRVNYSAHVGEYPAQIIEVADSLDELIAEITPQLEAEKSLHTRKVRDLHTQAKQLGYAVVPVGSGAVSGVAVLEGGE